MAVTKNTTVATPKTTTPKTTTPRTKWADVPCYWSRERKIKELTPISQQIAKKWCSRATVCRLEYEDLVMTATIGIIAAVDEYKPDRGAKLRTFAWNKANWYVLEVLRDYSAVSRKDYEEGYRPLIASFSQPVASHPGNDIVELGDVIDNEMSSTDDTFLKVCTILNNEAIKDMVDSLPPRESQVLRSYYYAGRTFEQIGVEMTISESSAYQIHGRGIKLLQDTIGNESILRESGPVSGETVMIYQKSRFTSRRSLD